MTKDIIVKEILVDLEKLYLSFLKNDPLTSKRSAELRAFDIQGEVCKILNMHVQTLDEVELIRNKILKTEVLEEIQE